MSPQGIILEKAREYFPTKSKVLTPSTIKSGDRYLKNYSSLSMKKNSSEKKESDDL